jgi:hypothetical protein
MLHKNYKSHKSIMTLRIKNLNYKQVTYSSTKKRIKFRRIKYFVGIDAHLKNQKKYENGIVK